jgi:hypothetical protein
MTVLAGSASPAQIRSLAGKGLWECDSSGLQTSEFATSMIVIKCSIY